MPLNFETATTSSRNPKTPQISFITLHNSNSSYSSTVCKPAPTTSTGILHLPRPLQPPQRPPSTMWSPESCTRTNLFILLILLRGPIISSMTTFKWFLLCNQTFDLWNLFESPQRHRGPRDQTATINNLVRDHHSLWKTLHSSRSTSVSTCHHELVIWNPLYDMPTVSRWRQLTTPPMIESLSWISGSLYLMDPSLHKGLYRLRTPRLDPL